MVSTPDRRALAEKALAGYVHGPAAATESTRLGLARIKSVEPGTIVIVEGVSDQIAVETLARRLDRDLDVEGVVVLPVGGAQQFARFVATFGSGPEAVRLVGVYDAGEEDLVAEAIRRSGVGSPASRRDLAALGFHVCVEDLEDELIRAMGVPETEALLETQGDLRPFRTLQKQAAWRDQPSAAQMRRFFGSGARRKLRYARLLVDAISLDRMPRPLVDVLDDV